MEEACEKLETKMLREVKKIAQIITKLKDTAHTAQHNALNS
jgi:hypothetical protein